MNPKLKTILKNLDEKDIKKAQRLIKSKAGKKLLKKNLPKILTSKKTTKNEIINTVEDMIDKDNDGRILDDILDFIKK